mmetsp:Transcript_12892/g.24889  ORF Transcript_12892/g.24889 Transcript_12892/m.24889 type:complete len:108 (+) Transcript_12892:1164-1487(+)
MGKATVSMDCGEVGAYCDKDVTFSEEHRQGKLHTLDGLWAQHASLPASYTLKCGRWHPATFRSFLHIDYTPLNRTDQPSNPARSSKFKVLQVIACGHDDHAAHPDPY